LTFVSRFFAERSSSQSWKAADDGQSKKDYLNGVKHVPITKKASVIRLPVLNQSTFWMGW